MIPQTGFFIYPIIRIIRPILKLIDIIIPYNPENKPPENKPPKSLHKNNLKNKLPPPPRKEALGLFSNFYTFIFISLKQKSQFFMHS